MTHLSTLAGLLLGSVFLASGGAKLVGMAQWRRAAAEFGAPRRLVPVLPWLEIVLGALLIVGEGSPAVPLLAIGALLVFTGAIVIRLADGRHPECACFGAWSAAPLNGWHIVRNLALMALGVVALF